MAAVAALPPRSQEELLEAITQSIYQQPPTDWATVSNLGLMRAVPEVKITVNLATQYVKAGYDPQVFMARLAQIVCHDNFTEMHAFKHHQAVIEEYNNTREPWRSNHLVCGVQAAAISFGKNMAVYEEMLDLFHMAAGSDTLSRTSPASPRGCLSTGRKRRRWISPARSRSPAAAAASAAPPRWL